MEAGRRAVKKQQHIADQENSARVVCKTLQLIATLLVPLYSPCSSPHTSFLAYNSQCSTRRFPPHPSPDAALYVTARPNTSDDVPHAILDGTRGKPPPVLSIRVLSPSFPLTITLDGSNLTAEGAAGDFWFSKPLIISG